MRANTLDSRWGDPSRLCCPHISRGRSALADSSGMCIRCERGKGVCGVVPVLVQLVNLSSANLLVFRMPHDLCEERAAGCTLTHENGELLPQVGMVTSPSSAAPRMPRASAIEDILAVRAYF